MKLLPKPPRTNTTEDSLGHGMDAVLMLVLFLAAGYGLDRLFSTIPVFMIVMTLLGSVGLFAKFKYRYEQRMDQHDAQRIAKLAGPAMSAPTRNPLAGRVATTLDQPHDRAVKSAGRQNDGTAR